MNRLYIIADIHGSYENLMKLVKLIRDDDGLDFKRGDKLVQLGDRCDRQNDTFRVNNFFYKLQKRYPDQVICLRGNHESLMLGAALGYGDEYLFIVNGGKSTMKSYKCYSNNAQVLGYKLNDCGHLTWLNAQPFYYETDEYFFSHAPIPIGADKPYGEQVLTWTYYGEDLEAWVNPDPENGKICVYGHIHGMTRNNKGEYEVPGIRQIGNTFLLDTGSGCHKVGYLSCLELTEMKVYTSRGEILIGEYDLTSD